MNSQKLAFASPSFGGLLLVCIVILSVVEGSFAQGTWTPKTPLPAPGRWAPVAFTIGTKGYLGTGSAGINFNDFWEYDPLANSWTQKTNFAGAPRSAAVGFSIGSYGYIGTGYDGSTYYNDFWQYDPIANSWTQVANMGGTPRTLAVGFSIAGKGYIGTGFNIPAGGLFQDLWEYDPISNTWTQKANYAGGNRRDIDRAVFVICNKAYLGTGSDGITRFNDFWEYDPIANTWTQKTNFPGTQRMGATGFSIGGRGFLGLGNNGNVFFADFWKYNPFTNSWSAVAAFPGAVRFDVSAFVINNKAYLGNSRANGIFYNDFWEFTPDSIIAGGTVTAVIATSSSTICVGQSVTLSASGGSTYSWNNGSANNPIVVFPTATTTYSVIASDTICGGSGTTAVTISVTTVIAAIVCQDVCAGNNTTLLASGGTNYLWSNGAVTNSVTVSPAATTNYSVIVSIGNCTNTASCTVNVFPIPVVTTNSITDVSCTGGNNGSAAITVSGGTSPYMYNWSPSGGTNAGVTGLSAGTYIVTVTDANGCTQIQTVTISALALVQLAVPNAFSPNGDGENDEFCLQGGIKDCITELTIVIYDRWGEKIFQSDDPKFCWDGTYHGKPMNTAVFVYHLEATLITGETIIKKRNISLLK